MLTRSLMAAVIVLATTSLVIAQSRFNSDAIAGKNTSTNTSKNTTAKTKTTQQPKNN
jgi:hypothetical protein